MDVFTIFISYAHKDQHLLDELVKHLVSLSRSGLVSQWWDRNISAGREWSDQIDERLREASIILLLVSPDFVNSEYCYSLELKIAMERHEKDNARVIPIILRPVIWQGLLFDRLQVLPMNGMPITLWQNIDAAFLDIVQGIKRVVEELATKVAGSSQPPNETQGSHQSSLIWNIPYTRNPFFTGRNGDLEQLHNTFTAQAERMVLIQVISGMGGIGKTQIALEYAYRCQDKYQAIFWLRSDTRADLLSDFIAIANQLNLPERANADQTLTITAVKRWLQAHAGWLLILDNLEDLSPLKKSPPY